MFNTFSSSVYTLLSLFCLVFGLGISAFGLSVGKAWKDDDFGESRYTLEKKVYLVTTFFTLGLYLKLFLIPLWFISLSSLMPMVRGSMCIMGVHMAMGKTGFYATAFKFFAPSVYIYWLILDKIDEKTAQAFMRTKLFALGPIGLLFSLESLLDFTSLARISPQTVSCCSSIFDVPQPKVPRVFMETSWFWLFAFAGTILYILLRNKYVTKHISDVHGSIIAIDIVCIFAAFISFILLLNTKIAPFFLNLPEHHCVFCLCQQALDVPLASFTFFAGIWLYLIFLVISSHKIYDKKKNMLKMEMIRILNISFLLTISGIFVIIIHFLTILAYG